MADENAEIKKNDGVADAGQDSGAQSKSRDISLVNEAEDLGIPPEVVDALDDDRLRAAVESVRSRLDSEKARKAETPKVEPKPAIDEDGDEDPIASWKAKAEDAANRAAELERRVREIELRSHTGGFERLVAGVPEEWRDVLGEGPSDSLRRSSVAARNRNELRENMEAIVEGLKAKNRPVPSESELFERALRFTFADKYEKIKAVQEAEKTKVRQTQFVGRPGAPAPQDSRSAKERAIEEVARKLASMRG